jgi:hypothetical protein
MTLKCKFLYYFGVKPKYMIVFSECTCSIAILDNFPFAGTPKLSRCVVRGESDEESCQYYYKPYPLKIQKLFHRKLIK